MRGNLAVMGIEDIEAVVIEGGERAGHTAHHGHRMRIAAETAIDGMDLLMEHRVMRDVGDEPTLLIA